MALQWRIFQTQLADLHRVPLLITGEHDAILVDGGFTLSTGRRIVDEIKASGKRLRMIFVTCADPDFYFSLAPVRAAFPQVPVLAAPLTAQVIAATAAHKIEVWRERLGDDGPASLADAVLPEPYAGDRLQLEGETIEIVRAQQPNRFYLWLPAERAILGGVIISSDNHVWMADTPDVESRASWLASLEDMAALQPRAAIPGHMRPGAPTGLAAIRFTGDYIRAFEEELPRAADGASLCAAMKHRYPDLAMEFILELGASVCKGETRWP